MADSIERLIIKLLAKDRQVASDQVAKLTGISRQAAHKRLAKLVREKKLLKIGTTRHAYYVPFSTQQAKELLKAPLRLRLKNKGLQEDYVFDRLEAAGDLIKKLPPRAKDILRFAFSEMLNNAIEHSRSSYVNLEIGEKDNSVYFQISDFGIGIYNNLREKLHLDNDFDALQELLKGKRTTDPTRHSGEGIFFTSKIADFFEIASSKLHLIMDNIINDKIIRDIRPCKGTKVKFTLNVNTRKDLPALFNKFTDEEFNFSKTMVSIKLYEAGANYVSRSQARRLLFGLDKFKTVALDFKGLKGIGQGFADEIFRVYKSEHPDISLEPINASPAVILMIKRASSGLQ